VEIQVGEIVKRLADKQIDLTLAPAVYEYLAKEGYNPQYGARPLRRLIQNKILTPVANLLISQEVSKGGKIFVDLTTTKDSATGEKTEKFTFDVKKKTRGESPIIVGNLVGEGRK
jgi:ATP-dependent Clp protease ATP-binding subunit ClpA